MLPADARIVGLEGCDYDAEHGILRVRVYLADGSIAASYWELEDLRRFMGVVTEPTQRPAGANLQ